MATTKNSVTINLTAGQKDQIKRATGRSVSALKVERAAGMSTKRGLGMIMTKRGMNVIATKRGLGAVATKRGLGAVATKRGLGAVATKRGTIPTFKS